MFFLREHPSQGRRIKANQVKSSQIKPKKCSRKGLRAARHRPCKLLIPSLRAAGEGCVPSNGAVPSCARRTPLDRGVVWDTIPVTIFSMNQPTKKSRGAGDTRREFLKKTTLAAAAVATAQNLLRTPVYGQTQAPAPGRVVGANNRLVVGYIGVGLQGMLHVRSQKERAAETNIVQAAACDLSAHRQAEAKEAIGDCAVFKDYEKLLERKDIDAVTISVVEHWHAKTAIAALQAGKHVYLEKPMTRYLGEAYELRDAVKSSGKVFQLGSQGCSGAKWQKAADLIVAGKIGPVVLGQASYMRNNPKGEWNTDPFVPQTWATAADLDWAKWQQPVHGKTDFSP